jgi:hypothetical protein
LEPRLKPYTLTVDHPRPRVLPAHLQFNDGRLWRVLISPPVEAPIYLSDGGVIRTFNFLEAAEELGFPVYLFVEEELDGEEAGAGLGSGAGSDAPSARRADVLAGDVPGAGEV